MTCARETEATGDGVTRGGGAGGADTDSRPAAAGLRRLGQPFLEPAQPGLNIVEALVDVPKLLEEPRNQNERQDGETSNGNEDHGVLQV